MSYYANPQIPESLSSANEKQLRSFGLTVLQTLAALAAVLIVLELAARFLAPLTPFSWERRLAPDYFTRPAPAGSREAAIEAGLKTLSERLAAALEMPPDYELTIHYRDDPLVNALAGFGGHIIIFRGLLEKMESEDALAAVLAHEMAHVRHRDPVKGLVRLVGLTLTLALAGSGAASDLGQALAGVSLLSYSRRQETAADAAATLALGRLYGHSQGFEDCFRILSRAAEGLPQAPEILSSHPDTLKRLRASRDLAAGSGFPSRGRVTGLPAPLSLP
ncbi:MAG: M48 family metallopeptidase [Candidatus Adiutrix sp.]|jgi:predicted Zn-dependent protease|nr:M48 family metallopeptidase [Candidatus Adiutrix sp.]